MDLSIVIPVFEESGKISRDIKEAAAFLQKNHLTGEIIVVDDGSSDNTAEAAKNTKTPSEILLKVVHLDYNRGKGYAVRTGIMQTIGEYVMFADSGCCVPYKNVLLGLKLLKGRECDIAHGSRKLKESQILRPQNLYRRICSVFFHWSMIYFMKIPSELTDTQCGFKIYRGDIGRALYRQCTIDGFMFDVEIILRALKQGFAIKEFPIEWTCDRDSRLMPARSLWRIFSELLTINGLGHPLRERTLAKK